MVMMMMTMMMMMMMMMFPDLECVAMAMLTCVSYSGHQSTLNYASDWVGGEAGNDDDDLTDQIGHHMNFSSPLVHQGVGYWVHAAMQWLNHRTQVNVGRQRKLYLITTIIYAFLSFLSKIGVKKEKVQELNMKREKVFHIREEHKSPLLVVRMMKKKWECIHMCRIADWCKLFEASITSA